jgi:uncharacterized protein YkwD
MKRVGAAIVCLGLLGALFSPATSSAANGTRCWEHKGAERLFAKKMNLARSTRNTGSLRLDPELSKVARRHTREMTRANSLHHTPSDLFTRRVTNWVVLGENVGVGSTVESLHQAFMNSPTHKENILLGSFQHVGVGTRREHGKLWVTVVFEARTDPGTTLRMPGC